MSPFIPNGVRPSARARSLVLSPRSALRLLPLVLAASVFPAVAAADTGPIQQAAADSNGSLQGRVTAAGGDALAGAKIELHNSSSKLVAKTQSDAKGRFGIPNIVPGTYTVTATKAGTGEISENVDILAGTAGSVSLALDATKLNEVVVTAKRFERARNALSPSTGSSQYTFTAKAIDQLPEGDHTPFNRILLQAPGVANDSFGQLHIRGDHNDIQYRLNGIILPEGTSGFGQVLDPRFAKSITLNTGALPAQYGDRTAGVIDIVTKDRLDGGDVDVYGGSHDTFNPSFQYGTTDGPFSGYVTGQYLSSNLGVENPTNKSNAIHDDTQQGKGFGYFSYLLGSHTKLSAIVAATSTKLEIPNNPGQAPDPGFVAQLNNAGFDTSGITSAGLNEAQYERNVYGVLALQGVFANDGNYQFALFSRASTVEFKPDPLGDLAFNGLASRIKRKSTTTGLQGDFSYPLTESHTLTTGFSASTEQDRADNTSQVFTTDPDTGDINGGPISITDNNPKNGNTLVSIYTQDKWDVTQSLTINYGLRYDHLDAYIKANQLSPRIGLIDFLTPSTTIHAGYARYFTPPPNELVASGSITRFANTTNAPEVTTNSPVEAERSHYFDAGLTHQLTSSLNIGVDAYYRYVRDLLDEGQFGNALIFTPFNYQQGHIYGIELTSAFHLGNFSSYLNVARSVAQGTRVASGEFNFGQSDLDYIANHYVYLDHEQRVTVSGGASYVFYKTTFGVQGNYGSGLRSDAVDPVTGDTTVPNGATVKPNVQIDLSASRSVHLSDGFGNIDLRVAALNVLDNKNIIRDGSGIGVGAPQFGPRAAVYFGIGKSFGGV